MPLAVHPDAGSEYAAVSPDSGLDTLSRNPPPAVPAVVGSSALPGAGRAIAASARFTLSERDERCVALSLIASDLPATGCDARAHVAYNAIAVSAVKDRPVINRE